MKHILLGDYGQSLDIVDATERVKLQARIQQQQSARLGAKEVEIARLKARTEQLHLAVTALSRFLIEKGVVVEDELAEFVAEIDASDGNMDGKLGFEDAPVRPKFLIPGDKDVGKQS